MTKVESSMPKMIVKYPVGLLKSSVIEIVLFSFSKEARGFHINAFSLLSGPGSSLQNFIMIIN
jgi:hypothetical protein